VRYDYLLIQMVKRQEPPTSQRLVVSSMASKEVRGISSTRMVMPVYHYRDRRAEQASEDHRLLEPLYPLLPPTLPFRLSRRCDSDRDHSKVNPPKTLLPLYPNNHSQHRQTEATSHVHLEVVALPSLEEEEEEVIEDEVDSIPPWLLASSSMPLRTMVNPVDMVSRCLIPFKLNGTTCKCTDGGLCHHLRHLRLLSPG
jgi:hypothetical protein